MAEHDIAHSLFNSLTEQMSAADFSVSQGLVKTAEGGLSMNPKDPGNYTGGAIGSGVLIGTNYGISAPVLSAYLGRTATADDMKNLTYDTALAIYKKNYWDKIQGDQINSQSNANLIYDSAVNQGVGKISGIVSDTLGLPHSTSFNSAMVSQLNAQDPQKVFDAIKSARGASYNSSSPFYQGWMSRLSKLSFSDSISEATTASIEAVKKHPLTTVLLTAGLVLGFFVLIHKIKQRQNQ